MQNTNYLIYSAEDDKAIKDMIAFALSNEGYKVLSFENGKALLEACEKKLPDLMLLDVMMPQIDGFEALKIFIEKYPSANTKIIMLTARADLTDKLAGLEGGAVDYITKPFFVAELLARVKAQLKGKNKGSEILKIGDLEINIKKQRAALDSEKLSLTEKEILLLIELAKNEDVVVEREILLKTVFGYEYAGGTRTVDVHIKNLREKIKGSRVEIISSRGLGYVIRVSK